MPCSRETGAGQNSFSNLLTFSSLYDSISRGEKSPVIILFMNQPPGVAAPLTGAFSCINKLCSAGRRSTVQHWSVFSRWLEETSPGAIWKRYPPLWGGRYHFVTISCLRQDDIHACRVDAKSGSFATAALWGWRRGELNPCPGHC